MRIEAVKCDNQCVIVCMSWHVRSLYVRDDIKCERVRGDLFEVNRCEKRYRIEDKSRILRVCV